MSDSAEQETNEEQQTDEVAPESRTETQQPTAELSDDEKYLKCMSAANMVVIRRPIFYKTLKLVRTESDGVELKKLIRELPEMKTSALTPGFFLDELTTNGALEATPVYAEEPEQAHPTDKQNSETSNPEQATDEQTDQITEEQPSEEQSTQAEQPAEERKPISYTYRLTNVGERVLASLSPSKHLERLYQKDEELDPAFDFVLDFCSEPRKRSDLERELSSRGFLASKDVSTSFYVDRLERAGGLEWDDGWTTTQEGREFLDQAV